PQGAEDFFTVDLGRTERFSRLELHLGINPLDFPRSFAVDVSSDGRTWTEVERDDAYFPDLAVDMVEDFSRYVVPGIFSQVEARYVRIRLTGGHPYRHWSIAEFVLRGD
ncbi:MAG: discoidin domain-containing protein, partial [Candidatus Aminicenantes bacterium]|nr:discoidin domain-containing protein [Candidatus Aminicenantes bacterium]